MPRVFVRGNFYRFTACAAFLGLAASTVSCDQPSASHSAGSAAPDFEFEPIDGKPQKLSDLRGKPVVVNFFATWCGPCMMELPELDHQVAKPFADRGLVVLIIGVDKSPDDVAEFKRSTKFSFLVATDPQSQIFSKFTSERGIPQTFLIKPDGTIDMHLIGYAPSELKQLASRVEKLLPAAK